MVGWLVEAAMYVWLGAFDIAGCGLWHFAVVLSIDYRLHNTLDCSQIENNYNVFESIALRKKEQFNISEQRTVIYN